MFEIGRLNDRLGATGEGRDRTHLFPLCVESRHTDKNDEVTNGFSTDRLGCFEVRFE
jgi:hypothetical protein